MKLFNRLVKNYFLEKKTSYKKSEKLLLKRENFLREKFMKFTCWTPSSCLLCWSTKIIF